MGLDRPPQPAAAAVSQPAVASSSSPSLPPTPPAPAAAKPSASPSAIPAQAPAPPPAAEAAPAQPAPAAARAAAVQPKAAAPAPQPAPAAAPKPAPVAAPAAQVVYVAGSGGQAMVDKCIGPIHFTPLDAYSLFIVEHDFCGGWAQFSGIQVGERVTIAGYGTYTATARGEAPQGGTTSSVLAAFGHYSKAYLQTCIPGTSEMLLIALD